MNRTCTALIGLLFLLLASSCGGGLGAGPGSGEAGLLDGSLNFTGPYPEPADVAFVDRAGTARTVRAFPGQVQLAFDLSEDSPAAQYSAADREAQIVELGGLVIGKIPEIGYYLVQVQAGQEESFITAMLASSPALALAVPNVAAVRGQAEPVSIDQCWIDGCTSAEGTPVVKYVPLNVGPGVVVLDDFNVFEGANHGQDVYQTVVTNGGTVSAKVQLPVLANGAVPGDKLVGSVVAIQEGAAVFSPGQNVVANLSFNAGGEDSPDYESNWYCMASMIDEAIKGANDKLPAEQRKRFLLVQEIGNSGQDVSEAFKLIRQKQLADGTAANHLFVGGNDGEYATKVDDPDYHGAVVWYKGCIAEGKCGSSFAAPAVAAFIWKVAEQVDAGLGLVGDAVRDAIAEDPLADPFMIWFTAGSSLQLRLEPNGANMVKEGGQGTFNVTAADGLDWTAVSNSEWISVVSGASGIGDGTVTYSVQPNDSPSQRYGSISVGSEKFGIDQNGTETTGACCCQQTCPCGGYPSGECAEHCPCCVAECVWSEFPNCLKDPVHDTSCNNTYPEPMSPATCTPQDCWEHVSW